MWILRFHLLQTKDYNKIHRICKKYGFITRIHSPIVFTKAYIKYITQKISWRSLGREFWVDHAGLHKFYDFVEKNNLQSEIFHVFLESRAAVYIGGNRSFTIEELDNSLKIYSLTQKEFESILRTLKNNS